MNKKLLIGVILIIIFGVGGWLLATNINDKNNDSSKQEVTLALDWTPNTNHTGIYVAEANGYYEDEGIDLKIQPYSTSASSDVLVGTQKADVGIGFTESVVAAAATDAPVTSIAAILPTNTSSITVRSDSKIDSLKDLDGKVYGGFGAPYEEPVMKQAIKNDGGKGEFESVVIDTALLDALESERVDFVWIYDGWQKIQAERDGLEIKTFPIKDNGVPDYYTPNIISSPETVANKSDELQRFMNATVKGYKYAIENPEEAAEILIAETDEGTFPDEGLVRESQKYLADIYKASDESWGMQKDELWTNYPQFMLDNNAVTDIEGKTVELIDFDSLYTNQFLD